MMIPLRDIEELDERGTQIDVFFNIITPLSPPRNSCFIISESYITEIQNNFLKHICLKFQNLHYTLLFHVIQINLLHKINN